MLPVTLYSCLLSTIYSQWFICLYCSLQLASRCYLTNCFQEHFLYDMRSKQQIILHHSRTILFGVITVARHITTPSRGLSEEEWVGAAYLHSLKEITVFVVLTEIIFLMAGEQSCRNTQLHQHWEIVFGKLLGISQILPVHYWITVWRI